MRQNRGPRLSAGGGEGVEFHCKTVAEQKQRHGRDEKQRDDIARMFHVKQSAEQQGESEVRCARGEGVQAGMYLWQ